MSKYSKAFFARNGAIGGKKSRRVLTPEQAKAMVLARIAKYAQKRREMK